MTGAVPVCENTSSRKLLNIPFEAVRIGKYLICLLDIWKRQDEEEEKTEWSTRNDPRITPVGKLIRRTSIDELPQLFNVLKGEMSLVGPRPERPQFVQKFRDEIPRYMVKHQVRPGMTGWAQINGYRGDTSIEKRIEYDLYYIENWTMVFDMNIFILPFFPFFFPPPSPYMSSYRSTAPPPPSIQYCIRSAHTPTFRRKSFCYPPGFG